MIHVIDFANGEHAVEGDTVYRVEAVGVIQNEDWKTAIALGQRSIQPGEKGDFLGITDNFYGRWARVQFDEVDFALYCQFKCLNLLEAVPKRAQG